ncbi:MAG TPA: helix-turn-helix transcriptional regulator [Chitinophaga sp.]|uniref:AraC family transcriptional regulator n=1 Tax=Chitinophaga sp. TaxID=1869181 RepID=UPI002B9A2CF8|nr:helix-turn-helix transcriptional regulator [Chitinophaga sp.]HVI44118.1 helix-turn-helix transcriptional regulator [Chitinophaga sp.]
MERIPVRQLHAVHKELAPAENFIIRDIGTLLAGRALQSEELHRHAFYYVIALEKGQGRHDIDLASYKVDDHSVFFLRPGQMHRMELEEGCSGYIMQFRTDFFYPHDQVAGDLLRKAGTVNHYQPDAGRMRRLLDTLAGMLHEFSGKQERYLDAIRADMNIFLIELIRYGNNKPVDNASLYMQERLETFLELLEKHVHIHKQVSHYAAMMNLSAYQLNAVTRALLGKTSSDLITESIILEAKRYLLATSNQVNQIADYLGYEDVSYFIRFFRKHTGHTPDAFRNNFR